MNFIQRFKVLLVPLVLALVTSNCNRCNGVTITPHEAIQLTFIDSGEHIRVRYTDDTISWSSATSLAALADAGVGASASPDVAGTSRVIAHNGSVSRLKLRFGLGPDTWDTNDVTYNNILPHRRPTIVDLGGSNYLLAMLGGSQNSQAVILKYNHSSRQFSDVTPTGLANLNNSMLHNSPAMLYLPPLSVAGRTQGRVVVAWLRHSVMGTSSPADTQIVAGEVDSSGNVSWRGAVSYNAMFPDPDYKTPHSEPSLSHDQRVFNLTVIRKFEHVQSDGRIVEGPENLYSYASSDGISWYAPRMINAQVIAPGGAFVEIAYKTDCTGVMAIIPITVSEIHAPTVYRFTQNPRQVLLQSLQTVFGPNLPQQRQFSLITTGRPSFIPPGSCW